MTRITRPTLADLWRVLLSRLECQGAGDVPEVARSLAIAALTGRPAEAEGVRVVKDGDAVIVVATNPPTSTDRTTPSSLRCRKLTCASS